ncbi:hypothetical protein ACWDBP_35110 [Streptomyces sp. NPDC001233]|uniref:hypothetical protein n=1 Tax=Streptomyces sp. NPDC002589 TaxID=3154420 RepID=UPI00332B8389
MSAQPRPSIGSWQVYAVPRHPARTSQEELDERMRVAAAKAVSIEAVRRSLETIMLMNYGSGA